MSETLTAEGEVRTYRGSSIEELLPRIRAELGSNAVILCQREGLVGGIGGFFQKRCVEVEARAGGAGIDVYDSDEVAGPELDDAVGPRVLSQGEGGAAGEGVLGPPPPTPPPAGAASSDADPASVVMGASGPEAAEQLDATVEFKAVPGPLPVRNDAATREGLSTPAVQELVRQAQPFAEMLEGASAVEAATEPAPAAPVAAETAVPAEPNRSKAAENLRDGLVAGGVGTDLAGEIVDAVVASALPFANSGRLRTLVRDELALRVPVARAAAPGRRAIAVVGPAGAGKTAAIAGIAVAHAGAGRTVACLAVDPSDGGAALESMLADANVLVAAVAAKELGALCRAVAKEGGKAVASRPGDDEQLAAAVARADLVLIDTPASCAGADGLPALGKALKAAGVDETHLALRAGTAAAVGAELAEGLTTLRPNRLLLTGAAETAHVGGALDVAIRCELPLGYVADSPDSIAPADARALASRVTP
jgi:flagellar biosynthesis GTPase FlhF